MIRLNQRTSRLRRGRFDPSNAKDIRALGTAVSSDAMMAEPARFVALTLSSQNIPGWEFRFSSVAASMRKHGWELHTLHAFPSSSIRLDRIKGRH